MSPVPMWPFTLSGRLDRPLVGRYPAKRANPTRVHPYTTGVFHTGPCGPVRLCSISNHFWLLSLYRAGYPALLTRPPLKQIKSAESFNKKFPVRLACVKHAASVHPEPGSNSPDKVFDALKTLPTNSYLRHYCF